MRRGIAIFLALMFGVGPLSAALPGAEDASLPSCCRRHGAHHCAMAAVERDGKPFVSAPATCPYYPGPTFALLLPAIHALTAEAERLPVFEGSASILLPGNPAGLFGPCRAHAGRGPPASLPA